jgi:hypothetical protein
MRRKRIRRYADLTKYIIWSLFSDNTIISTDNSWAYIKNVIGSNLARGQETKYVCIHR